MVDFGDRFRRPVFDIRPMWRILDRFRKQFLANFLIFRAPAFRPIFLIYKAADFRPSVNFRVADFRPFFFGAEFFQGG